MVSNLLGTAVSGGATVVVSNSAPVILAQPASQAVFTRANTAFSVTVTGSEPLGYQWRFNGSNIAGATRATLNLADITAVNVGSYQVVASNAFGTSLSSVAVLTELSSVLVGWGDKTYKETTLPASLSNVVAIAGGSDFSLALQGNGIVGAWGYNGLGAENVPPGLSNVALLLRVCIIASRCRAMEQWSPGATTLMVKRT